MADVTENAVLNGNSAEMEENEVTNEADELVVDSTENAAETKSKKKKKKKKTQKTESNEQEVDSKIETADEIKDEQAGEVEDEGIYFWDFCFLEMK